MNSSETQESVAIIGMAGRFPHATNLDEFWHNLRAGRECVSFFDDSQVQWLPIEHPPRLADPRYVKARAVLEKPEWFDAAFFGMNPKEASVMDPQHRVFLECAWEALEQAGCNPDTYPGLIGVFAGASMNTYLFTNLLTNPELFKDFGLFSSMIMNDGDFVPTRASYKFNLRGPSLNVQTACSTSLVAVCLAAQNLLGYRCDVALAGGVSITFPAHRGQHHQEGGILSPDGHCRAFDAQAAGTVLGDGCGVVTMKRLSDALADGDNVLAVIKGTAINNDGSVKIGYTAPSSEGQAEVIALAQSEAGVAPETISYVEAHGTGTPLGDPIEIEGLTKAFGAPKRTQFCAIGSVKSNIGHLDIAAGVAGLIKTVLALQKEEIPPSLHFERPNPKIDFARTPFFVNHALRPWPRRPDAPRRAGVSSFGIGGTNSHAVLEEAPALEPTGPSRPRQLLLLSARTATALEAATANLAAHLQAHAALNGAGERALADVAYTLQVGRKVFAHRRAVVVSTSADAAGVLQAHDPKRLLTGRSDAAEPKVAFLFPGQGAQAVNMSREIYATEPGFRANVDRCCVLLQSRLGLDLRELLFPAPEAAEAAGRRLTETRITQPALFVIEYSLAQLWLEWGVKPSAMIGHSLGEYVAATLAGVMSLEDALLLVAERARLMQAQPEGAMLAVRMPEAEIRPFLKNNLALAAVNAPGLCVVSGPFDAVSALERELAASAIPSKRLATSHAFHSAMMEPAMQPLADALRRMRLNPPKLPWVSNLTGRWITPEQAVDAAYWTAHLRQTVRFADGVATLVASGHTVLLEVGPGSTLTGLARQHGAAANGAATPVASLGRAKEGGSELAALLTALGELWVAGVVPAWRDGFYRREKRRIVSLPTYPFERKRYWIEPAAGSCSAADGRMPLAAGERSLTTTGTPEAADLPAPAAAGSGAVAQESTPVGTLRRIFQDLSGMDLSAAGEDETFYELGFDSLFLTQASRAVSKHFGAEITFRQLREDLVTFGRLAAHVAQTNPSPREAPTPTAAPAVAETEPTTVPLSAAQREVWLASQMSEGASLAYNESLTLRLDGELDRAALERALRALVARHEALRVRLAPGGDAQRILPTSNPALVVEELPAGGDASAEERAAAWLEVQLRRPFELVDGNLFRPTLLRVDSDQHWLALIVHHVICDGWSLGLLARELGQLYAAELAGKPATLPPAPSLREYLEQQAAQASTPARQAAADYWRREFQDGAPVFDLPADRARRNERDYSGRLAVRALPAKTVADLKALCARQGCTTFTALLAAYSVLVHRLSGSDDIAIGVPSAGQVMGGESGLVGHFANLLAIRSNIAENPTFAAHLARLGRKLGDGLEHCAHPFGELLRQLDVPREPGRAPLAPVVFNTTGRHTSLEFGPVRAEARPAPKPFVHFDLNLHFGVAGETVELGCYYSTELFDPATIERWLDHLQTLLQGAAAAPATPVGELPLLTESERQQIVLAWNRTQMEYPRDATIPELFEAQVRRTPDAIAVVGESERVSYAELNRRADAIAARLRAAGVGQDARVGLFLGRTPQLLAGILGILKAGGGYVPLDPSYPSERLAFIVEDTRMPVLVTEKALLDRRPAGDMRVIVIDDGAAAASPGTAPLAPATAESLAYIIYTSGSTGRPKGVQITHRCVSALVAWAKQLYTAEELSGVFFSTSASFDISIFEIFCPLCLGGRLVVAENILQLRDHPARQEVTFLSGVPSAMAEVVRAKIIPESVTTVALAGELFPQPLVDALYALPHMRRVFEHYGPTETTVYSTGSLRRAGGKPSLGFPFPNERVYVLDRRLQPVPVGVAGELYIGGDKLARGYLNRPELTAEKFIAAPFLPGERLYKTGDGARFLADGSLEFAGRLDHQVKIRGFRVELGEIEAALARQDGVAESVVIVRPDPSGNNRLLGYVVPRPGSTPEPRGLRELLAQALPEYMVPAAITVLEKFPLTANGKLDRRALPEPDFSAAAAESDAPRNLTEELLADIWRELLQVPAVGVRDNFFELGGHSLIATQVLARVQEHFGVELTLRQFFLAPRIAAIAPLIEQALIDQIKAEGEPDVPTPASKSLATAKE